MLASAIALASCSQEDIPDPSEGEGNRVLFHTSLPVLSSRAQEITQQNLHYFYVTAFDLADTKLIDKGVMQPLFDNEEVNTITYDNVYTSPNCCWPSLDKESHLVSFFGFHPGLPEIKGSKLVNASTTDAIDYKLTGFSVNREIADQVDFITAYTTGTMADNLFTGIKLNFAHQLSRIEIKAYGAHKSCDIEIAGVRIGGIGVKGTFDFQPIEGGGRWTDPTRGIVEYIYNNGDEIFSCGKNHPVDEDNAISIMGKKRSDNKDNCAMIIPSTYTAWDNTKDPRNDHQGMYISVLLRVTDATPTAGKNPTDKQRFPYHDLSQGAQALSVPVVYLAVNKESGKVSERLYKFEGKFYTDTLHTNAYPQPASEVIKEFGWAAIPVKATWSPGYIYTYTLDYTHGVGLLDPEVTTTAPRAGDPVISDKVGITFTVKGWQDGGGKQFPVPGS